jgi:WXG100 family type VII secretion target
MADVGMTYAEVENLASRFQAHVTDLESLFTTIQGEVAALEGSGWTGLAYKAFSTAAANWIRTANIDKTDLDTMKTNVNNAKTTFQDTDGQAANYFPQ